MMLFFSVLFVFFLPKYKGSKIIYQLNQMYHHREVIMFYDKMENNNNNNNNRIKITRKKMLLLLLLPALDLALAFIS